jgi:hypothetical protein
MASSFGSSRIMAILPYKGWFTGHLVAGIPAFHVSSEYGEVGGVNWGETYLSDRVQIMRLRKEGEDRLIGDFVDVGAGHFEWNPEAAKVIAMFIRKSAQYRLPKEAGNPEVLREIDPKSGWLIAPDLLGTDKGTPVPYNNAGENAGKCLWYYDREMAEAVNSYMASGFAKKRQVIDFVERGAPVALHDNGFAVLHPQLLPDDVSFRVAAVSLDKSPTAKLYNGEAVGHASGPILFKVSTGSLKQTGADTFRVWRTRGGLVQQGPPWEPWIMAVQPGNAEYRRADRPGRPLIPTVLVEGKEQHLTLPPIPDQPVGTKKLKLKVTSDSKLPVQVYVISGPVEMEADGTLRFLPIPPRSHFPVEVVLGAYQWGRIIDPLVMTADSVDYTFHIKQ